MVEPGDRGPECLLTLQLHTSNGPATLVSVYAPTLTSSPKAKDEFYANFSNIIQNIPISEHLVLLGDVNARVGADHDSWPSCLGQFGVGKMNVNGQHLLELCSYHGLCVTNAYFQTKSQLRVSWRHPRSKHWHQLDLIIVRCVSLKFVLLACIYHSTDCDTDHSLVCCKLRLQPRKFYHTKQKGKPHIKEELDAEPTLEDLGKAIESLACGKAPGTDGIPPDLVKCCKTTLLQPLHDVLCHCWREGGVPEDMRDA